MTRQRQPLSFLFRRRAQLAVAAPMFFWVGLTSGHWLLSQAAASRLRAAAQAGAQAAALRGATDEQVHAAVVRSLKGSPLKARLDRPQIGIAGNESRSGALTKAAPGDTLVVRLSINSDRGAWQRFRWLGLFGAQQRIQAAGAARKR
jgi:hypothetical protein